MGNLTSTLIGFYVVGRLIKFCIDTLVHGKILYDIYGISWKLIASIWDSVTNLLSHNHLKPKEDKTTNKTEQKEQNEPAYEDAEYIPRRQYSIISLEARDPRRPTPLNRSVSFHAHTRV